MKEVKGVEIEFDKTYKKRRIKKKFKVLIFLLCVVIIAYSIYFFFTSEKFKVSKIVYEGVELTDVTDIDNALDVKVGDNVIFSYFLNTKSKVEHLPTVEDALVVYDGRKIVIKITEKEILFSTPNYVVLNDKTVVNKLYNLPSIYIDNFDKIANQDEVIKSLLTLKQDYPEVFNHISQISLEPSVYSENRLAVYMRDKNKVYVRDVELDYYLSKYFNVLDKVFSETGKKNGVFHFDNGSKFEPYD